MTKIGTAHVEIKPVLNESAIRQIEERLGVSIGELTGFQIAAIAVGDLRDRVEAIEKAVGIA